MKVWNVLFFLLMSAISLEAQIRIVTTTTDLKYFAEQVGGDKVTVDSLLKGDEDPHFISVRPDFLVKIRDADLFCEIGLDLEIAWSPLLLQQSRNPKIQKGKPGYCNASIKIKIEGQPLTQIDRSMGDIHIHGNPHYWTDPLNAIRIAETIRDSLIRIDSSHADFYQENFKKFKSNILSLTKTEMKKMEPYFNTKVAVYHDAFLYFTKRFKLQQSVHIEEKPGVVPSSSYLEQVVEKMRKEEIRLILLAPFDNQKYAKLIVQKIPGVVLLTLPLSVQSESGVKSYEDTIHTMTNRIVHSLKKIKENKH